MSLNVNVSQVQNSSQDPEELHLLVRLQPCNYKKYTRKFVKALTNLCVCVCVVVVIVALPRIVKALRVRSKSDKSSTPGICICPPWLV